jgi:VIT1/CCC1 family predicted Fe2+/Mn2+ transporter
MEESLRKGLSFGMTSGVITTLGLIVGIDATTNSELAVMAGIVSIAIADAFSDAAAMHVSEESERAHSAAEVRRSTASTFLTKFLVALSFLVPVVLLQPPLSIIIDVLLGFLLIIMLNLALSMGRHERPLKMTLEHVTIAAAVVAVTYLVGTLISLLL